MLRVTQTQTGQKFSPHVVCSAPAGERAREAAVAAHQGQPGNQLSQHRLRDATLQPKLTVNAPGDEFEREAERVADQIMRMPVAGTDDAPLIQRTCVNCTKELQQERIQRVCSECEEELQRKPVQNRGGPEVHSDLAEEIDSIRRGGTRLPQRVREFFEPRFGHDFSEVRLHTGGRAGETARSVDALAYTIRDHIVFSPGRYQPETDAGRRLLAHELTHVVQQRASKPTHCFANSTAGSPLAISQRAASNSPIQRLANPALAPGTMPCPIATTSAGSVATDILFPLGSSVLDPAALAAIAAFLPSWRAFGADDPIRIDGFASLDGDEPANWMLSCARAQVVRDELKDPTSGIPGVPGGLIEIFAHGETDEFGSALPPNRRATIASNLALPPPAPPLPCNLPTNPDRSGRADNPTTDGESLVTLKNPIDALDALGCRDDSFAAAGSSGLAGPHLGPQDAFRHCFWSCCMAREMGASDAEKFGTGHENSNLSSIPFDNAMDLHNNAIGRSLASGHADCDAECKSALSSGLLRTIRGPHSRPPSPSVTTECIGASDQPWP